MRLVIVGGGIAGLATAYYAQQAAAERNLPLAITLVERDARLGGKIVTDRPDGFVIEGGPDSFITQKPWALQLCRELGLEDRLIGTNDARKAVYVLRGGRLRRMPEGLLLVVPTQFRPFLTSRLISWRGKLRMGLDWFIPPRRESGDESLADFIRRRLGREALDVLAEPMMAGIHVADAERLSIQATFPRFVEIEQQHGSLIRGMLAARRARAKAPHPDGRAKTTVFMTLRGGLAELVGALERALHAEIVTGHAVARMARRDGRYTLTLDDGRALEADAVVLATPAYAAAALLRPLDADLAARLDAIRYVSTATVSLGYAAADFPHPLDGFGYVVPRSEPSRLLACTWTSTKFPQRAAPDSVLLRAFVGGPRAEELAALDDDALIALVREELGRTLGVQAAPRVARVFRWPRGNPQYDVGHLERVAAIEAACPSGVYLTGSAYRGVGIPDCVKQGQATARAVVADLRERAIAVVGAPPGGEPAARPRRAANGV